MRTASSSAIVAAMRLPATWLRTVDGGLVLLRNFLFEYGR